MEDTARAEVALSARRRLVLWDFSTLHFATRLRSGRGGMVSKTQPCAVLPPACAHANMQETPEPSPALPAMNMQQPSRELIHTLNNQLTVVIGTAA
jgi:hypothetical protein